MQKSLAFSRVASLGGLPARLWGAGSITPLSGFEDRTLVPCKKARNPAGSVTPARSALCRQHRLSVGLVPRRGKARSTTMNRRRRKDDDEDENEAPGVRKTFQMCEGLWN